jgi:hypothetical protein
MEKKERRAKVGDDGKVPVQLRVPPEVCDRWWAAADQDDRQLTSWITTRLNRAAQEELGLPPIPKNGGSAAPPTKRKKAN